MIASPQAAELLGVTRATLYRYYASTYDDFPQPVRVGRTSCGSSSCARSESRGRESFGSLQQPEGLAVLVIQVQSP
nr:AlpA family phage regulatory protein [Saccharopolyspora pogona]